MLNIDYLILAPQPYKVSLVTHFIDEVQVQRDNVTYSPTAKKEVEAGSECRQGWSQSSGDLTTSGAQPGDHGNCPPLGASTRSPVSVLPEAAVTPAFWPLEGSPLTARNGTQPGPSSLTKFGQRLKKQERKFWGHLGELSFPQILTLWIIPRYPLPNGIPYHLVLAKVLSERVQKTSGEGWGDQI